MTTNIFYPIKKSINNTKGDLLWEGQATAKAIEAFILRIKRISIDVSINSLYLAGKKTLRKKTN